MVVRFSCFFFLVFSFVLCAQCSASNETHELIPRRCLSGRLPGQSLCFSVENIGCLHLQLNVEVVGQKFSKGIDLKETTFSQQELFCTPLAGPCQEACLVAEGVTLTSTTVNATLFLRTTCQVSFTTPLGQIYLKDCHFNCSGCSGHGTCLGSLCQCDPGYDGVACEIELDPTCLQVPVLPQSLCFSVQRNSCDNFTLEAGFGTNLTMWSKTIGVQSLLSTLSKNQSLFCLENNQTGCSGCFNLADFNWDGFSLNVCPVVTLNCSGTELGPYHLPCSQQALDQNCQPNFCFNNCSNHGVCNFAKCQCQKTKTTSFHGIDCSIEKNGGCLGAFCPEADFEDCTKLRFTLNGQQLTLGVGEEAEDLFCHQTENGCKTCFSVAAFGTSISGDSVNMSACIMGEITCYGYSETIPINCFHKKFPKSCLNQTGCFEASSSQFQDSQTLHFKPSETWRGHMSWIAEPNLVSFKEITVSPQYGWSRAYFRSECQPSQSNFELQSNLMAPPLSPSAAPSVRKFSECFPEGAGEKRWNMLLECDKISPTGCNLVVTARPLTPQTLILNQKSTADLDQGQRAYFVVILDNQRPDEEDENPDWAGQKELQINVTVTYDISRKETSPIKGVFVRHLGCPTANFNHYSATLPSSIFVNNHMVTEYFTIQIDHMVNFGRYYIAVIGKDKCQSCQHPISITHSITSPNNPVPTVNEETKNKKRTILLAILGTFLGIAVLSVVLFFGFKWWKKRQSTSDIGYEHIINTNYAEDDRETTTTNQLTIF